MLSSYPVSRTGRRRMWPLKLHVRRGHTAKPAKVDPGQPKVTRGQRVLAAPALHLQNIKQYPLFTTVYIYIQVYFLRFPLEAGAG